MSLIDSAASGDRLEALRDLRDTIASTIVDAESARDIAALSRQLTDVLDRIAALAPEVKVGDPVDEIAERRSARRAGSAPSASRAGQAAR